MRLLPIYFPHDLSACCGRQELAQKAQEFILCTGNINDCRVLFLHNTGDVPSNACRVHAVLLVVLHLADAPGDASTVFIIAENAFLTCFCKPGADVTQFYDGNMDAVGLDFVCQSVRVRRNGGFACRVEGLERNVRYGSNRADVHNMPLPLMAQEGENCFIYSDCPEKVHIKLRFGLLHGRKLHRTGNAKACTVDHCINFGLFLDDLLHSGVDRIFIGHIDRQMGNTLHRDTSAAELIDDAAILFQIRIPRTFAAILLGGALALSGYLLQTFFHNPIAGPFVLGISSGAKLFVAVVMIVFLRYSRTLSSVDLIVAAFAGSMLSMFCVLLMSPRVQNMSFLVLIGVMIGYICSAVTDFLVTFAEDSDIVNLHNWSMGSFSGITWENVKTIVFVVAVTGILTFFLSKPMEAYQLGETYAKNMGVNIKMFRVLLVILSSILSAVVTAFAGPVSFVGIAVPQMVKRLFRTAKPIIMIPACFLGGAVFCMFCDLLARMVFAPTEMSISTVTAIFGAPVMIAVMLKQRQERY